MKNITQHSCKENSPVSVSSETIEYYLQKSQQERNDSIANVFNKLKSHINRFFMVLKNTEIK